TGRVKGRSAWQKSASEGAAAQEAGDAAGLIIKRVVAFDAQHPGGAYLGHGTHVDACPQARCLERVRCCRIGRAREEYGIQQGAAGGGTPSLDTGCGPVVGHPLTADLTADVPAAPARSERSRRCLQEISRERWTGEGHCNERRRYYSTLCHHCPPRDRIW